MNCPAYPKYKDSGVQWLGEVPEHWEIRPVKAIVSTPVTDGPHETPEILNEGIPFVSAEAISNGKINFDKIRGCISEEDHRKYSRKYKPEFGDIYMVKSGATTGRVAMVETHDEFNIWSPLAAIRCNPSRADKRFIYFYLQSKEFQTGVELSWSFGTQQNIGMGVIQNLAVPLGTLPEQTAIADFLDRETGRIDTLVAKKRRLIALLGEKRTSLISRTVTRGLPAEAAREFGLEPHTRFKDSTIEWLGEVPEGWEVKKLKHFASAANGAGIQIGPFGGMLTDLIYSDEGEFKVYGQENTLSGDFSKGQRWITRDQFLALANYQAFPGDVLFTRKGSIGGCVVLPAGIQQGIIDSDTIRLRVDSSALITSFLLYAFKFSAYLQTQVQELKRGAILSGLNTATIANLIIIAPSLPEQTAIAIYLDRETSKIDQLVTKVEAAIARLQEYRTALITAAVTGKIDVRDSRHSRAGGSPEEVL